MSEKLDTVHDGSWVLMGCASRVGSICLVGYDYFGAWSDSDWSDGLKRVLDF